MVLAPATPGAINPRVLMAISAIPETVTDRRRRKNLVGSVSGCISHFFTECIEWQLKQHPSLFCEEDSADHLFDTSP